MGSFEPIVFLAKLATEAAVVQIAGCSSTQCAERRAHALRHETSAHHIVDVFRRLPRHVDTDHVPDLPNFPRALWLSAVGSQICCRQPRRPCTRALL